MNTIQKFATYKKRIQSLSEWFYIAAMALYLIYRSLKNTNFDMSFIGRTDRFFIILFSVVLGAQALTHLKNKKSLVIAVVVMAVSIVAYHHNEYFDVLMAGFLIAGAIDVKAGRILKIWIIVVGTIIIAAALAAFSGIIENYVYVTYRTYGYRVRAALGTVYPTDSATWILFALAYMWAVWKKITDEAMLLVSVAAVALFYFYHNSQTAVVCGILFLIFILFDMLCKKTVDKMLGMLISIITPLSAFAMLIISIMYGRGVSIANKLDRIIDNRFSMTSKGLANYGIKLLGTNFKMYGSGSGIVDNSYKYFYLDSSYMNILIRFGIIIFVIYIALWIFTAQKISMAGERRLLLVAILITIHSIEEHHFAGVIYNPLFFMALARFVPEKSLESQSAKSHSTAINKRIAMQMAAVLLTGLILVAILPTLISSVRTIYQGKNCDAHAVLDADRNAIKSIMTAATAPVYSDVLPSLYKKEFEGFTNGLYFEGDHSRTERCTVLVDSNYESIPLLTRGFLYSQISEHTSVYTNDKAVADILMADGYHVTGFYNTTKEATLKTSKKVSKLNLQYAKYTATFDLHLKKKPKGISENEDAVVCTLQATSEVVNDLNTPDATGDETNTEDENDTGNTSETIVLSTIPVMRSEFDEDGNATINFEFTRGVDPAVSLSLVNEEGYKAIIKGCEYAQNPDYDIHKTINDYGQIIRSEYFDLDGNRVMLDIGYSIAEYEYNQNGFITYTKYYDTYENRVINYYGYSALRDDYDEFNRIVAEGYYDVNDNPIEIATGQAADTRVLDGRGNIIDQRYFDADGKPATVIYGYSRIQREYDSMNRVVGEVYYGTDGNRINLAVGYSEIHRIYDDLGRVIEESYYGLDGESTTNTDGIARIRKAYNELDQVTRVEFIDADGNRTMVTEGASAEEYEYDANGRISYIRYYDAENNRTKTVDGYSGIKKEYDEFGRVVVESYFDESDSPIALSLGQFGEGIGYDNKGNINTQKYYGSDGNLIMNIYGYAEVHKTYDDSDRVIEEDFFDTEGQLTIVFGGYSCIRRVYDDVNRIVREECHDTFGNFVNNISGYAIKESIFNESWQVIEENYYDADNTRVERW